MRIKTIIFKRLIWVLLLYETFHLEQNSDDKSKGVRGRDPTERPYENGPQKGFFIFDIYAVLLIIT